MREKRFLAVFSVGMFLLVGCTASRARLCFGMDIVRDHQPRASIVTPDDPFPVVQRAAEELQYHIRKSTGANLAVIPESQVAAQPSSAGTFLHRIYLGDCKATRAARIDVGTLPPAGFVGRLIGNDLFLAGHDSDGAVGGRWSSTRNGTLFAVYEFLENDIHWSFSDAAMIPGVG